MRAAPLVLAAALCAAAAPVEGACSVSATPVSFGVYDVFQASPTDSTGTVTYRCGNTDHHITITISSGSAGTFTPRTLRSGADTLGYNLFRNAAFTEVWGDGAGATATYFIVNPPNNQDVVLPVYARIPAGQDARAGTYGDSVVVTVEY